MKTPFFFYHLSKMYPIVSKKNNRSEINYSSQPLFSTTYIALHCHIISKFIDIQITENTLILKCK